MLSILQKKHLYIILLFILSFNTKIFAGNTPEVPDLGLPGDNVSIDNVAKNIGGGLITTFIKYVAVIAVIALMLSGIMYLMSGGEEEKVKKAKNWIIWSLVGVVFSISAWGIINLINNLKINN